MVEEVAEKRRENIRGRRGEEDHAEEKGAEKEKREFPFYLSCLFFKDMWAYAKTYF